MSVHEASGISIYLASFFSQSNGRVETIQKGLSTQNVHKEKLDKVGFVYNFFGNSLPCFRYATRSLRPYSAKYMEKTFGSVIVRIVEILRLAKIHSFD
jgi:hypothetical protein